MAELLIKIGTHGKDPLWQDMDVAHCFNNRRIRWEWATNVICPLKNFGFTSDGLRPPSLALKWYEHTHQYKTTRISRDEVDRYDRLTGITERFSACPNAKQEYIHVENYLKRRVSHEHHKIFGTPGHEVWYGGRKDFSNTAMDLLWRDIETYSRLRECNFLDFPLSIREKQIVVAVRMPDVSDDRAEFFQAHDFHDIIDPVKHVEIEVLRRKRQHQVDYRQLPFIEIKDVLDLNKQTDYRENMISLEAIHHKEKVLAWL